MRAKHTIEFQVGAKLFPKSKPHEYSDMQFKRISLHMAEMWGIDAHRVDPVTLELPLELQHEHVVTMENGRPDWMTVRPEVDDGGANGCGEDSLVDGIYDHIEDVTLSDAIQACSEALQRKVGRIGQIARLFK